jgi:hypothetical protein
MLFTLLLAERIGMKNHTQTAPWLLLLSLSLLLHACSLPFGSQNETYEVVDRTRPADAPWKYTATPNLGLTATGQVQATATQEAIEAEATQQAESTAAAQAFAIQSTATAAARESAIASYDYYDPFNEDINDWRVGAEDNEYWQGSIAIKDGAYTWQVASVKQSFVTWSEFKPLSDLADFDVALRVRRALGEPHQACFGLLFRQASGGIDAGTYILSVCDNGYYKVLYYDAQNGWDVLQDWTQTEALIEGDWNLLEVSARGEDFHVWINHLPMLTFSDSRLPSGRVSILLDLYGEAPVQIECDFFALQSQ